uniref:ORF108 n=1 Tax=Malaco herpesvirus 1 TaxID=3031797 RepID=A0AA48SIS9_9VIRU|nr:TPA_asm: ORF108 [Malaco herpesvirus 1]
MSSSFSNRLCTFIIFFCSIIICSTGSSLSSMGSSISISISLEVLGCGSATSRKASINTLRMILDLLVLICCRISVKFLTFISGMCKSALRPGSITLIIGRFIPSTMYDCFPYNSLALTLTSTTFFRSPT